MQTLYPFPPDAPSQWRFYAVHIALATFALGALIALCLRSRKPARWRDVPIWLALVPAAIVLGNQLDDNEHIAPFATLLTLLISIVGVTGAVLSCMRTIQRATRPQTGLAFAMLGGFTLLTLCLLPSTPRATAAARRSQCKNNLKLLALGLHNFADANGGLPEAMTATEPPRSWRVELLPMLDEASLRAMYLNERPWDHAANIDVGRQGLQHYSCPSNTTPKDSDGRYYTAYAALTGSGSVFSDPSRTKFPSVADGSSNTLLLIEACGREIVWTEPRDVDITVDPVGINLDGHTRTTSPGVASAYHTGGFNVALADGAVRFVSDKIDQDVLKKLLTADGGESLDDDAF